MRAFQPQCGRGTSLSVRPVLPETRLPVIRSAAPHVRAAGNPAHALVRRCRQAASARIAAGVIDDAVARRRGRRGDRDHPDPLFILRSRPGHPADGVRRGPDRRVATSGLVGDVARGVDRGGAVPNVDRDVDVASAVEARTSGLAVQVFRSRGGDEVRWRLISANGRELGRSVADFSTPADARAHAEAVARRSRAAALRVVGSGDRAWIWELDVDGEVAVRASHTFDRRIRCEQAASLFLQILPEAEVRHGVIERSGRRGRRRGAGGDGSETVVDLGARALTEADLTLGLPAGAAG